MASSSLLSPLPLGDDGDAEDSLFGLGPLQQARPPVSPSPPLSPVPQSRPGKRATRVNTDTEGRPRISRSKLSADEKLAEARILREAAANRLTKLTEGSEEHRAATKEFEMRNETFKRLERESKDAAKKTLPPPDADFDLALFIGPDPQVVALQTQALAQQEQVASLEEQLGDSTQAEQESLVGIAATSGVGDIISVNLIDAQKQLDSKQARIASLTKKLEENDRSIADLSATLGDRNKQIAQLAESLDFKVEELEKERDALRDGLDKKTAAHAELEQAIQTQQQALSTALAERGSALEQLLATRTEENSAEVDAKIEELVGQLNLSRENEQKLNLEIEGFRQRNKAANAEIARLNRQINANVDSVLEVGQKEAITLQEKNKMIAVLEAQNKKLREQLASRRNKISNQAKEIGELKESLSAAATTPTAEKRVLDELNTRLRNDLEQLQARMTAATESKRAVDGELAEARVALGAKDHAIQKTTNELDKLILHLANVGRDLADLRVDLEKSQKRATALEEQNQLLSEQITALTASSSGSEQAFERATTELKKSMEADQLELKRERDVANAEARRLGLDLKQLQRDAESNREELAGERTAFRQQMEELKSRPGFIARKGPLEGFSYSSSSSDEEAYRRRARSQNSFRDALVDDDSPSSSEPVRVSRPESSAPTLASVQWTRPPVRSGAARRREIIDINNFKPDIPAQAEAWKVKLEGVARDINIGDPDRVYRSVEQLLRSTHPSESEFYHRFYTMIGWVEGACAKNKGAFWIAKTEGLQHLTKDVIEAATTKINTIPISEAEFFPLSRDELTTGIARELTVYRRMTTGSGRKVEVAAPAYQLVKSADDYRNTVIRRQQDELNDAAAGFWREGDVAERERASMNQQRYLKRNPEAPLLGFGQRYVESKAVDRLDPGTLTLFNYESALIIPYNFWYFLQEKIISKLNVGHDKYVVELKNMTDHAWTNVPAGHTINDIAHYLADNLWDKLQIRHAKGSTERIPSVLSVKKMLDDLAIKRVTEQMSFIDANYNQAWQDRIVALLQTAVHPNAFNSFITALAKIGYPFDVYDPRLNRVLQNITFANLVGAIYQQNVLSNRAGGVTGRQIVAADSKVSRLIDELSRSLGISTTFAYTPPQTIYGGFARSSSSSSSSSDPSTASIPSFLSI